MWHNNFTLFTYYTIYILFRGLYYLKFEKQLKHQMKYLANIIKLINVFW